MTAMGMGAASVPMMAAMMLPSAVPAIARRARERDGVLAAPLFAGSYLGTWALAALATWLLYRPPGAVTIAVVVLAQKLLPPHPAVDVPLALAIVGVGVAIAAT
jgi:predicted metal-binding membrane protein